jgi:hypothetical protein
MSSYVEPVIYKLHFYAVAFVDKALQIHFQSIENLVLGYLQQPLQICELILNVTHCFDGVVFQDGDHLVDVLGKRKIKYLKCNHHLGDIKLSFWLRKTLLLIHIFVKMSF